MWSNGGGLSRDRGARVVAPLLSGVFSVVLVPAWVDALGHVEPALRIPATILGVLYTLACVLAVPLSVRMSEVARGVFCMTLVAAGVTFVGVTGIGNSWVLLCGLGIVAALMPTWVVTVVTTVVAAGLTVTAWETSDLSDQFANVVVLVSVTAAVALMVRLTEANEELQTARDQVAELAAVRERQRVARDLHDILGHSLTTITIKAGLARRALETGSAEQARGEIGDVERLSRQALGDVRSTVSEFRETSLAAELAGVRETLRAAGIDDDLPTSVDDVEPHLRQVFAHVLRESVTNAVRHSGAGTVTVRLGRTWAEVEDDGAGVAGAPEGNGLTGLRERLAAVDGTLRVGAGNRAGTRVRAEAGSGRAPRTDDDGTAETS
ncbi:sensor histidine kinase [Pseudonocardia sp. NPDC049635]|uniref:sensor histidine kinase n=1 Tax=Pseudonocardia sp. NPDC049635 TaxID=3155506 RepID=UPI0033D49958